MRTKASNEILWPNLWIVADQILLDPEMLVTEIMKVEK